MPLARDKTFGQSARMDAGFVAEYRGFKRRLWSGRFQGRVPIFLSCMRTAHAGPQWRVARVRLRVRGCCCNFTSHQVWSAVRLDDLQRCPELKSSCACLLVFASRPVARMHLSGIAWGSRCTSGGFCLSPSRPVWMLRVSWRILEVGDKMRRRAHACVLLLPWLVLQTQAGFPNQINIGEWFNYLLLKILNIPFYTRWSSSTCCITHRDFIREVCISSAKQSVIMWMSLLLSLTRTSVKSGRCS